MLITLPKEIERWRFCRSDGSDRKRTEEGKKCFQNKTCALVPKIFSMRKEEGAAVDSSAILPYLSSAGSFVRARRAAFFHGNLQTFSGKAPLTTTDVLPSTRNAKRETRNTKHETRNTKRRRFSVIWLTLQNRWYKYKDADESEKAD